MKAIHCSIILICFYFLSANAVINQEAQRREAPNIPQNQYGPPLQRPPNPQQRRIQAMQRLIAAMRNGASYNSQARVVNQPRPIPIHTAPQNTYGPPISAANGHSSSSGSLHSFTHNHNPDVRCDGWIPITGPSIQNHASASGSASSSGSIDTSYGPPNHSSNSGSSSTLIVVPEESYQVPPSSPQQNYATISGHSSSSSISAIDTSYGVPSPPIQPHKEYGVPNSHSVSSGHASSIGSIDTSYGVPNSHSNSGHASSIGSIDTSYGVPNSHSVSSGHASSIGSIDTSYGVPPPPANPQPSYGPPSSSQQHTISSGHSSSSSISSIDTSYGVPPPPIQPQKEYGPPATVSGHAGAIQQPHNEYGPPIQQPHNEYGPPIIVGSGQASSATAIGSIQTSHSGPSNEYGPPNQQPSNEYRHPQIQQPAPVVENSVGHQSYGVPQISSNNDLTSYGPPPSGQIHAEEIHHATRGHAGEYQQVQSIGTELQLPEIDSGSQFNNAIGLVSSTLGVSGNSEVIKSHAIHESHTSEVANSNAHSFGSDTYSAPPLDSYQPGKYNPSFLNQQQQQQQRRPIPQQPIRRPQPQYIPPVPMKLVRPQVPPPNFRPLPLPQNGHAQSIAQSYSSQSHSSHSQKIRHPPPRQQPLIYRPPVPQGLLQSIGQSVQAQDNGYRGQSVAHTNTYLPPPANELPIPPMRLVVPNPQPAQPFNAHTQSYSGGSGVATSSSTFSLQNHELRNVHVIHDCGKGPQLSQNYGTPLAPPLTEYLPPSQESHSAVLSTSYEIPAQNFEVPQHSSVDFNSPANSYGPPASGPASLDVIGLESRGNSVIVEPQPAESNDAPKAELPGLSNGLSGSGLDFISATKSHTLVLPTNQSGPTRQFQLNIQSSHSDQSDNRVDGPNHQQILADGLLQSILNAIEQPAPTVPQVTEDAEQEHKEAKKFLESKTGQEVLAEKKEEH